MVLPEVFNEANSRVNFANTKKDEDTYIAAATTEKTYRGTIIKAGIKV